LKQCHWEKAIHSIRECPGFGGKKFKELGREVGKKIRVLERGGLEKGRKFF